MAREGEHDLPASEQGGFERAEEMAASVEAGAIEYRLLSTEEETAYVDDLTAARADMRLGPPDTKFSTYFLDGAEPAATLARTTELIVFWKQFDNDPKEMQQAYGPYEDASKFVLVVDNEQKRAAGVVRLIENSPAGFPSLNDVESYRTKKGPNAGQLSWGRPVRELLDDIGVSEADLDHAQDLGTTAVIEDYRKSSVILALYRATYLRARQEGVKLWVSIVDDNVLEKVLKPMDFLTHNYSGVGSGEYLGSGTSTPVFTWVDQLMEYAEERGNDFTYSLLDPNGGDEILGNVDIDAIRAAGHEH